MIQTTHIWQADPHRPSHDELQPAAEVLRRGGLVAFPTETVYGLGADALNPKAVSRIFEAKGRPQDNPLIVHVASLDMAYSLMGNAAERPLLDRLAREFWPGPITLVVTASARVPGRVTAGLDTVGLRMPAHPVALALIEQLGRPVAAPSANRSGVPSPTLPEHVWDDLKGRIEGIVAAGECNVGVESTVLDITVTPPVLLRPGGVTPEALEEALGRPVTIDRHVHVPAAAREALGPVRSPGMKYRHYAPRTPIVLVETGGGNLERLRDVVRERQAEGKRVGLLVTDEATLEMDLPTIRLGSRSRPEQIAQDLFRNLRAVDALSVDVVVAEGIEDTGVGLAVMNRLRRAAAERA